MFAILPNPLLEKLEDPILFPGGDIGSLAVHGTVIDLAVSGARPLYLSAGFITEKGLPAEQESLICSPATNCRESVKLNRANTI